MENLQQKFDQLEDAHRKREDLMKARIVMGNQIKAIERRMNRANNSKQEIDFHNKLYLR